MACFVKVILLQIATVRLTLQSNLLGLISHFVHGKLLLRLVGAKLFSSEKRLLFFPIPKCLELSFVSRLGHVACFSFLPVQKITEQAFCWQHFSSLKSTLFTYSIMMAKLQDSLGHHGFKPSDCHTHSFRRGRGESLARLSGWRTSRTHQDNGRLEIPCSVLYLTVPLHTRVTAA